MAEQYIYSRAEKGFVNALGQTVATGHGFMGLSSGMNNALTDDAKKSCENCPKLPQTDSQGVPLPLFRKTLLPKGQILLQKSAWIVKDRDFHVAHGYVLEDGEMRKYGPDKWFDILFRLEDPNAEPLKSPLGTELEFTDKEPFHAKPLKEAMEVLGLGQPGFCQMLLACLDAVSSTRQVLVAWDFEQPEEQALRRSVLYWIYTFLPYDLWIRLGFDSIYTSESSFETVQLAFVDKRSISGEGQASSIQLENKTVQLEGSFLIRDGEAIHNDRKYQTEWYGKAGVYARWLEQAVNTLWECPAEELPSAIQALSEFRQNFQKLLDIRGEDRLNPQWYGDVCVRALSGAPQALAGSCERVRESITEDEKYDSWLAFMDSSTEEECREIFEDFLQAHKKSGAPVGEKDIAILRGLFKKGLEAQAAGLVSVFAAREADAPGADITAALSRCQEPPELYSMMLKRFFFSDAYKEDAVPWADFGVDSSVEAAKRRRDAWFAEKIPENKPVRELPDSIGRALEELKGLEEPQLAQFWQEPFRNRCGKISEEDLSGFVKKETPPPFRELEEDLSKLPGGKDIPADTLDPLRQKVYDRLLADPAPFMDSKWLKEAADGWHNGGEVGETLEILSAFTNAKEENFGGWKRCCKGKSEAAQFRAVEVLPKMFLNGNLPEIRMGFIMIFLFMSPEDSRKILLQAACQGGGGLLMDLLMGTRKYPWKYWDKQSRSDRPIFCEITEIISEDPEIADKLGEKPGGCVQFYEDLKRLLQEPETQKVLSSLEISDRINSIENLQKPLQETGAGAGVMNKRRR